MAHLSFRRLAPVALAAGLLVPLAACSSDKKADTSTTTAGSSPEDHIADDATVTAGLGKMTATAATISTSVAAGTKVTDASDQLEADWSVVEGTVRKNEAAIYLDIEDALQAISTKAAAGDAAGTAAASGKLATSVAAYLAKHP